FAVGDVSPQSQHDAGHDAGNAPGTARHERHAMKPESRGTLSKAAHGNGPRLRSRVTLIVLAVVAALFFAGFIALGTWQLQRLQWKLDLIERVDRRVHAAPVPAPGPERWPQMTAESDEYRRVRVNGDFLHERSARVHAVTALGSGYWLLTPLRREDGSVVLINRGFIPPDTQAGQAEGAGPVNVTGLLRMSEPGGAF